LVKPNELHTYVFGKRSCSQNVTALKLVKTTLASYNLSEFMTFIVDLPGIMSRIANSFSGMQAGSG